MTSDPSRCVDALATALPGSVLSPDQPRYSVALGGLFSTEASLTRPCCVVRPANAAEVAATLKIAQDFSAPVTVRGGSHSSLCAADQAVMIDLSARLYSVELRGEEVVVGGGAAMGSLLQTLSPASRLVPVGVARTPGMGLALQGGVGYLTRSLGLTLDHLRAVEIVVPSGAALHLSDQSRGDEADLWWAVRGCAPNLGVVTSATFRVHAGPIRVFAQRLLLPLDALPAYLELAQALPRDSTASAVLGPPAGLPGDPVLFAYLVHAGDSEEGVERSRSLLRALTQRFPPLMERDGIFPYSGMPPMDVPPLSGFPTGGEPEQPPAERLFAFKKSPFLRKLDATTAAGLVTAIRSAPTSACRIDLQHCGGATADVAPDATAFWNRGFEWNCPLIGASLARENKRDACTNWVRQTAQMLAPVTAGLYSVEVIPGLTETPAEVELAFGKNLPRLRALKKKWDPHQMFRLYYPLGE